MTEEQQDALVGRLIRESRAADEKLQRLLARAELIADRLSTLSIEIGKRVKRAQRVKDPGDNSAAIHGAPHPIRPPASEGIENLSDYASVLDLNAIQTLDHEIAEAEERATKLRDQKRQHGV